MQLSKKSFNISAKKLKKILVEENEFITNLFSIIPTSTAYKTDSDEDEKYLLPSNKSNKSNHIKKTETVKSKRANSLVELRSRFEELKSQKMTIKQKLGKKKLKNKIKKTEKKFERSKKNKLVKAVKNTIKNEGSEGKDDEKHKKSSENGVNEPVFNKEGSMVFSKIDFSEIGKQKKQKVENNPKKILKQLEMKKEKIKQLQESGETEKAALTKQKEAWKSALAKAEGVKVKDDPILLKKSAKRKEQMKKKSSKKWEQRKEAVKKVQEERQKKRSENIKKKKETKKANKIKKSVKKGRVVL